MMFLYQVIRDHIMILGCSGYHGTVKIPEKIDERPVEELAAYAFSPGRGHAEVLKEAGDRIYLADSDGNSLGQAKELPLVSDEELKELSLPKTIKKIGNYAFYNCFSFAALSFYSSIEDIGSGLFTGCTRIRNLDIYIVEGKRSCMKDVITELRQELYVNYYSQAGEAKLVFTEMYEEAVEHTPARIIMTEMHGCGHMYRYCFEQSNFLFHKYDALFPHLLVQEPESVVAALVMGRLRYPVELMDKDRCIYEDYLKEHVKGAMKLSLENGDTDQALWLGERYGTEKQGLDSMIEEAGTRSRNAEVLSYLMDLRHQRFAPKKRTFSL
jgi:hypothetical protein